MQKINLKDKKTLAIIGFGAVVLVPILWHQISGIVMGQIAAYQQSLPKTVQVSSPQEIEINPEFETTGRVEAIESINVIARINGWLEEVYFKEGDLVKKGQKLYKIEPDEYLYDVKNAQARVSENRAVYNNSEIELKRATQLLKEDFISREHYDNALAKRNKDRASLDGAIAQLNNAKLNLSYTNIVAPMDGRIGKLEISKGNYVNASAGTLTSIYRTNPMRVTFSVKSSVFIELKKYYAEEHSKNKNAKDLPVDVYLKLADGKIYDQVGKIEYFDNKIDETTGSISLRARFDNPHEILVPGDYVNVILKAKKKEKIMVIPQSASKTDVGTGYYVWVVEDGKTVKRDIEVTDNVDNNWVVKSGLKYSDVVIVKGIQDIYQSGQAVKTEPYTPDSEEENKETSEDK